MTNIAIVFPGQGSQSVGMMTDWGIYQSLVEDVYAEASDALGYDLWKLVSEGPELKLNQTEITQPAMLCAGVASWKVLQSQEELPEVRVMAGHSLGEYTALVCAGSLDFESAVKLVSRRGQLMQQAVGTGEGAMAAVLGLSDEEVVDACAQVFEGVVEAVNFNAPGQVVIAGNRSAVENAMAIAKSKGAKRVLPLPVSVPSHCTLMKQAAESLFESLESTDIKMPAKPVVHNQNAEIAQSVDEIKQLLRKQLYLPVKWVDSVQTMHRLGVTTLIECGPGKVLSGLTRRIDRSMTGQSVFDLASLEKTTQSLLEQ